MQESGLRAEEALHLDTRGSTASQSLIPHTKGTVHQILHGGSIELYPAQEYALL